MLKIVKLFVEKCCAYLSHEKEHAHRHNKRIDKTRLNHSIGLAGYIRPALPNQADTADFLQ
jgi:hypothetical protein